MSAALLHAQPADPGRSLPARAEQWLGHGLRWQAEFGEQNLAM